MRKVVFLINSLTYGGAERVISVIVNELSKQGYEVELICLERDDFYSISERVKVSYLSNFTGRENGIKKMLFLPVLGWRLKEYIRVNDIKLIQSHLFRANYVNIISGFFNAIHVKQIVTAGRVGRYKYLGVIGRVNLFLIKFLYKKSDLIVCKARGMQDDMQKIFNFQNKKIVLNNPYNVIDISNSSKEGVSDFYFDPNKKYIISVGRLVLLKRNSDLVCCLRFLSENIEIIFLGEGSEKNNLIQQSEVFKLKNRVHFLGQVNNPYKYISRADIFVSCSDSEGFPNVLVESMICNTPVISTDCVSGPREILAPDTDVTTLISNNIEMAKFGILYPIGDVESLGNAINILLDNEVISNGYARAGLIRANDFGVETIIKKYKEALGI